MNSTPVYHAAAHVLWDLPTGILRRLSRGLLQAIESERGDGAGAYAALDLLAWGKEFLPEHFTQPPSAMHRWLAGELDRLDRQRGGKVNVIGPRGGAKSTLASLAYVLRAAAERREPYIWLVSDTRRQAELHLANIKCELTENRRLAEAYPRSVGRGRRWQAAAIELASGTVIEAFGTGQAIRGRRQRAVRPTLIVCDDLQNDSHMVSASQRESSRCWFEGTLLKAGDKRTNVVNLATALHRDALALRLARTPGWRSRTFAAIEQWPQRMDLWHEWETLYTRLGDADAAERAWQFYQNNREAMHQGARLLWPEVEDLYTLMRMRVESGRTAFEREKQGAPINPESCEWPEEYFAEHAWFDDWPPELVLRTVALDPSKGSGARHGDYSAFVLLGIGRDGAIYVEADLARRATPQMVADGVALCRRFRPHLFGVEANQWQELLAGEFAAEFARQGELTLRPCTITNYANKQLRIRRLGPYLSQRRIRFHRGSAATRLLVEQLRDFPTATHDDGPDALEMALRLAEQAWRSTTQDDGLGDRLCVPI